MDNKEFMIDETKLNEWENFSKKSINNMTDEEIVEYAKNKFKNDEYTQKAFVSAMHFVKSPFSKLSSNIKNIKEK